MRKRREGGRTNLSPVSSWRNTSKLPKTGCCWAITVDKRLCKGKFSRKPSLTQRAVLLHRLLLHHKPPPSHPFVRASSFCFKPKSLRRACPPQFRIVTAETGTSVRCLYFEDGKGMCVGSGAKQRICLVYLDVLK